MSEMTPEFDYRRQKAFDFLVEGSKQLLSVASGIIAFTVVFSKDFVSGVPLAVKVIALIAWLGLLASICFGILALYCVTGILDPGEQPKDPNGGAPAPPSVWASNIRFAVKYQQIFFVFGLVATTTFGALALVTSEKPHHKDTARSRQRIASPGIPQTGANSSVGASAPTSDSLRHLQAALGRTRLLLEACDQANGMALFSKDWIGGRVARPPVTK